MKRIAYLAGRPVLMPSVREFNRGKLLLTQLSRNSWSEIPGAGHQIIRGWTPLGSTNCFNVIFAI